MFSQDRGNGITFKKLTDEREMINNEMLSALILGHFCRQDAFGLQLGDNRLKRQFNQYFAWFFSLIKKI